MIKAAFFDIDGTLLSFKTHQMPESTRRALARLRERGVKVVIASGRSTLELNDSLRQGFDAYITLNGQLCYDDEGAYRDVSIAPADARHIVDAAFLEHRYDILIQQRERSFVSNLSERVLEVGAKVGITYHAEDYRQALAAPIYQFCVFVEPGEERVFLDHTHEVKATRWNNLFCDVVPCAGGKSFGVAATLERYGLAPDEAIAFGDGENDISLFEAVGTSVAMGNASDVVKERATMVTDDVDSDGIWNACEKLGLL